jgi:hypothetical protein
MGEFGFYDGKYLFLLKLLVGSCLGYGGED